MNGSQRVSVVISFLDAEQFLAEAVESVLAQTFTGWEILFVDDGSTDASTRIALTYVSRFPSNMRYFDHPGHSHRGLPSSRNLAVRHARGEFLALLDSDDVWRPGKLAEQIAIFDSHPKVAMVCGASRYWFSWTQIPADVGKDFVRDLGVRPNHVYRAPELLFAHLREKLASPCPSSLILRRDAVLRTGGFEQSFVGHAGAFEDQAFLAKIFLHTSVYVSGACWDNYRVHPASYTARINKQGLHDSARLFYLAWLERYLNDAGVSDARIRRSLSMKLWAYRHPKLARFLRPALRAYRDLHRAKGPHRQDQEDRQDPSRIAARTHR